MSTDVERQIYNWFEADPYRRIPIEQAVDELNRLCPSLRLVLETRDGVAHLETASDDPGELSELHADVEYLTECEVVIHARLKVAVPHPFVVMKVKEG